MDNKRILIDASDIDVALLFGNSDKNVNILSKAFNVSITFRDEKIIIVGSEEQIHKCKAVLDKLILELNEAPLAEDYVLDVVNKSNMPSFDNKEKDVFVCMTTTGKAIRAKTEGQNEYLKNIKNNTITFGVGPAGTGKTYLAMAMAITAFKNNEVSRIILTRPVVEAGERLGFLPGDLQSKIDPYLRPLYDALNDIMGMETFLKNLERGAVEIAPLAYMRGRTLDNAFIILDEAQNTTKEQMKMFLTRIGFGSKVIITGDTSQIDLPRDKQSGLADALEVLKDIDDIGISKLTNKDVVRHKLVARIVKAYEKQEDKQNKVTKADNGRPKKVFRGRALNTGGKYEQTDSKQK